MTKDILFKQARPTWPKQALGKMNQHVIYRTTLSWSTYEETFLLITGMTFYKVYINGDFIYYGPSRAGHGVSKVKTIELTPFLNRDSENLIAIEIIGHNVNGYGMSYQEPFLQAEIISKKNVIKYTAATEGGFDSFMPGNKEEKVSRYSYQRPFAEAYALDKNSFNWMKDSTIELDKKELVEVSESFLVRDFIPTADFSIKNSLGLCADGTFRIKEKIKESYKDRFIDDIDETLLGFQRKELTSVLTDEILFAEITDIKVKPETEKSKVTLKKNEFSIISMGENSTGFLRSKVKVTKKARLYITFDEILSNGIVDQTRLNTCSIIRYDLDVGEYQLESLEPYTFQFIQFYLWEGEVEILRTDIRNLVCKEVQRTRFKSKDEDLNLLFETGVNTFKQNVVDIFMDCPSRERAGWLCDSFFMGRAEFALTGFNAVEFEFLRNYDLAKNFRNIPDGMLPMNYPGDQLTGKYIPNWAMWFLIELEEYFIRTGDRELVDSLSLKTEKLLTFFEKYQNEFGLLEKLDSWVFIEWSKANDFAQDVNYPSNMLYVAALMSAGRLYKNDKWIKEGEHLKEVILEKSYNGEFFVDNALRENGEMINSINTSETCQYFAFFFKIATPATHKELWEKLTSFFGPARDEQKIFPKVYKSNAFIGNLLRIDLLGENNLIEKQLKEIKEYYLPMAQQTKTFWEMNDTRASLNHGFASHICLSIIRDTLGINIDFSSKQITWEITGTLIKEFEIDLPIGNELLKLVLKEKNNQILYFHNSIKNYQIKIENKTGQQIYFENPPS